jgi:hypothetical protein
MHSKHHRTSATISQSSTKRLLKSLNHTADLSSLSTASVLLEKSDESLKGVCLLLGLVIGGRNYDWLSSWCGGGGSRGGLSRCRGDLSRSRWGRGCLSGGWAAGTSLGLDALEVVRVPLLALKAGGT